MTRTQAGADELANKTGPERAGPETPLETEPWTESTADLKNVLKRGAGMSAIGLVIAQIDTLTQALIQRERDIEDAANTVLIVTFATGLLLAVAVLVASPLIGVLFHDSRVGLVAAACSGI